MCCGPNECCSQPTQSNMSVEPKGSLTIEKPTSTRSRSRVSLLR